MEETQAQGQETGPLRRREAIGAGQVPQPLRQGPYLRHHLRGHRRLAGAQAQRGRRRLVARAGRAVHARGRVSHVPRSTSEARDPGREGARSQHCPGELDDHRRGDRPLRQAQAHQARRDHRAARRQRDRRTAHLLDRRGTGLPDALARLGDAVGRRGAANPLGQPDRQLPGRGALRPGRTVDRSAPARQPPTYRDPGAPTRPWQLRHRRRTRRRDHSPGRLHHRHRSGGRGVRRSGGARRHLQGTPGEPRITHRSVPLRGEVDSHSRDATQRRRQETDHQRRARQQSAKRHGRRAPR